MRLVDNGFYGKLGQFLATTGLKPRSDYKYEFMLARMPFAQPSSSWGDEASHHAPKLLLASWFILGLRLIELSSPPAFRTKNCQKNQLNPTQNESNPAQSYLIKQRFHGMRNISVFFCFVQNPLNSAQNELNPAQNQLNELNSAQSDLLKCRFHGARSISSHIYKQLSSPGNQLNPAQHNFLNKWFWGRPQGGGWKVL